MQNQRQKQLKNTYPKYTRNLSFAGMDDIWSQDTTDWELIIPSVENKIIGI